MIFAYPAPLLTIQNKNSKECFSHSLLYWKGWLKSIFSLKNKTEARYSGSFCRVESATGTRQDKTGLRHKGGTSQTILPYFAILAIDRVIYLRPCRHCQFKIQYSKNDTYAYCWKDYILYDRPQLLKFTVT